MGRYAMTYADTAAFPQTVGITPVKLGYISAYTKFDGADADVGENSLRAKVPGTYVVEATIALTTDADDNFYLSLYQNGVFTGFRNVGLVTTSGFTNITVRGIVDIDVNDLLEVYINSGTDSSFSVTVGAAQFDMRVI